MIESALFRKMTSNFFMSSLMGDAIAAIAALSLNEAFENGQTISAEQITQMSEWKRIDTALRSLGKCGTTETRWPALYQTPQVRSAFAAHDYPSLLDVLFCGGKWRAPRRGIHGARALAKS